MKSLFTLLLLGGIATSCSPDPSITTTTNNYYYKKVNNNDVIVEFPTINDTVE